MAYTGGVSNSGVKELQWQMLNAACGHRGTPKSRFTKPTVFLPAQHFPQTSTLAISLYICTTQCTLQVLMVYERTLYFLPTSIEERKKKKKKTSWHLPYPPFSADPGGPFHFPFSFSLSFLVPGAVVESSSNTLNSSSPKASAIFRSWETQAPYYPRCSASAPTATPREASAVAPSSLFIQPQPPEFFLDFFSSDFSFPTTTGRPAPWLNVERGPGTPQTLRGRGGGGTVASRTNCKAATAQAREARMEDAGWRRGTRGM